MQVQNTTIPLQYILAQTVLKFQFCKYQYVHTHDTRDYFLDGRFVVDIWPLAFGLWHLAFSLGHLAVGIWHAILDPIKLHHATELTRTSFVSSEKSAAKMVSVSMWWRFQRPTAYCTNIQSNTFRDNSQLESKSKSKDTPWSATQSHNAPGVIPITSSLYIAVLCSLRCDRII